MSFPPAYQISWGTYGGHLNGSAKPFVDKEHNQYGTPFPEHDPSREAFVRSRMTAAPVSLTVEQREQVESAVRDVAERYGLDDPRDRRCRAITPTW